MVHGVLRVQLIDVTPRGQIYVDQKLKDMGYADEAEEGFLSKVNYIVDFFLR